MESEAHGLWEPGGAWEKRRDLSTNLLTPDENACVCMSVSSGVKVRDLYHIPAGTEHLWGRDSGIQMEEAEGWGWGGDGAGMGGQGRSWQERAWRSREGMVTAGRPACHAKEHGLHSKAIGAYCLGGVSDLSLAWVMEL